MDYVNVLHLLTSLGGKGLFICSWSVLRNHGLCNQVGKRVLKICLTLCICVFYIEGNAYELKKIPTQSFLVGLATDDESRKVVELSPNRLLLIPVISAPVLI